MKKQTIFSKLWFKIVLGIVGVVIIAGGLLLFFSQGKVSQTFIDKYNEAATISADMITVLNADLATIEQIQQKEKAGDYKGIEKIANDALAQNSTVTGKIDLHKQRISELRSLSSKISDSEVKDKALVLINLIEEEDIHLAKGFDIQKQLLEMLRSYYVDFAAGRNPSISADALIKQSDAENKIISELSDKIVTARDAFFKVAELEVDSSSTTPAK